MFAPCSPFKPCSVLFRWRSKGLNLLRVTERGLTLLFDHGHRSPIILKRDLLAFAQSITGHLNV